MDAFTLALFAFGGAGFGLLGTGLSLKKQQEAIEKQKTAALEQYGHAEALSNRQWRIQKGEAEYQLGAQERALREGMGQFAGEYNTAMLARAFGEQDARIQNAANAGMSRVQEGMGGTRGNAANELMRAYAGASLERNIDLQRRQDSQTLANTVTGAERSMRELGHERDSWEDGGWRAESKAAQDAYNLQLHLMGQAAYDDAIWESDWKNIEANGWDYLTSAFNGAMTGLSLANSLSGYAQNAGGGASGGGTAAPAPAPAPGSGLAVNPITVPDKPSSGALLGAGTAASGLGHGTANVKYPLITDKQMPFALDVPMYVPNYSSMLSPFKNIFTYEWERGFK